MSSISARVDAKRLMERFRKLESAAQRPVGNIVADYARQAEDMIKTALDKPVARARDGKVRRSRPGQAPRRDTGRMRNSIRIKNGKTTMVKYVTIDAKDKNGNRYPFMLESGTAKIKKRPFVKRVQRKLARPLARDVTNAIKRAVGAS